jgi:hypothetical protein
MSRAYLCQSLLELLDELWCGMSQVPTFDFRYKGRMERFIRDWSESQGRLLFVILSGLCLGDSSGSRHCSTTAGS